MFLKSKAVVIIGIISILFGIAVIIGWEFHITYLLNVFPQFVSMKFNAALGFILLGIAALLTQFRIAKNNTIILLSVSMLIILVGLSAILEDLFHFDTGLDELFTTDKASIAGNYPHPGRMGAATAACFVLFGLAFCGLGAKRRWLVTRAQYLLHLITAISALSIVGYLYGLSLLSDLYFAKSMAVHSATLFFLLSVSLSLLHPTLGITGLFTGKLIGNRVARRLFMLFIFILFAFGAFRVESLRLRLFSEQTDIALLALCFVLTGLAVTWYTAKWLNKIDVQRQDAEEEILVMNEVLEKRVQERSKKLSTLLEKFRESESKFRAAFEHSAIGMALVSLKGRWIKVNKRLLDVVGYREHELLSMSFNDLDHPQDEALNTDIINSALQNKDKGYKSEKRYVCKNGAVVWVSINLATVLDKKGGPLYFVGQFEDISERKIAEQHLKNAYEQIAEHVHSIHDIAWKQSHLVRSPLANLQGLVALLKDDPSARETLNYIEMELQRLDNVIIEMAEDASNIGALQIAVKKRILKLPIKQLPTKLRSANIA